jgi:hypothetical protein
MLGLISLGFFALLLIVATGGWFLWFMGAIALLVFFGCIHYLLWGQMMAAPARDEPPTDATADDEHANA